MPRSLAYEGMGQDGPPLLLLHAFPVDRGLYARQLAALGEVARVVLVDLPGFGGSPARGDGRTPVSMAEMGDAVVGLATSLGFERFALGGVSMGGYVALAMLERHRARVSGLALISTRAAADTPEARKGRVADADRVLAEGSQFLIERMLPKLLAPGTLGGRPELVERVKAMMARATPAGIAGALRGMGERADTTPLLAAIDVPTVVVTGSEDAITGPDIARPFAAAIPGAELTIIQGAGHLSPVEMPDEVTTVLRGLVDRVR
jgi:3-oxoadipate enol-lactonase